jgi:hypothetical protein
MDRAAAFLRVLLNVNLRRAAGVENELCISDDREDRHCHLDDGNDGEQDAGEAAVAHGDEYIRGQTAKAASRRAGNGQTLEAVRLGAAKLEASDSMLEAGNPCKTPEARNHEYMPEA